jgi:hypothetical protein
MIELSDRGNAVVSKRRAQRVRSDWLLRHNRDVVAAILRPSGETYQIIVMADVLLALGVLAVRFIDHAATRTRMPRPR